MLLFMDLDRLFLYLLLLKFQFSFFFFGQNALSSFQWGFFDDDKIRGENVGKLMTVMMIFAIMKKRYQHCGSRQVHGRKI